MKTLIAVPCGDSCPTDFVRSLLQLKVTGENQYTFAQGSLVYDARNKLAEVALEGNFDRIMWFDSDMSFLPDTMLKFHADLDEGREMVCGLFSTRKPPIEATVYDKLYVEKTDKGLMPVHHKYEDYPKDEIFEVAGCGFAAVMMTGDLLRRVHDTFGLGFTPAAGFGEDLSFCLRAHEMGAKIYCDPRILVGHIGTAIYFPPEVQI